MEWNTVFQFIDPQLLIVVVVCWVIGYVLKITPRVPDWIIVYAVAVVGVVVVSVMLGWTVQSVIQGILCGAVAVYGDQVVKQTKKSGDGK